MFGLDILSAGLLHLAAFEASPASPTIQCRAQKPLIINVVSKSHEPRYDFSKKTAEINDIGIGAYSPYGDGHSNIELRGLTVGKQTLGHNAEFYFEKYKAKGLACLQIHKVTVTLTYAPIIYISTKFKQGTPIFDKILEHEKHHVTITQNMIDKYKPILKEQLESSLKKSFVTGPFPIDDMARAEQKLQDKVKRLTAKVDRAMHIEARKQHNQFDDATLNERIEYNQSIARKLEGILKINE